VAALSLAAALLSVRGADAQAPQVKAPEPTVPEIFTLMGQYVRVAYNKEGYVTLGYRAAQQSVGEEWVLLEVGLTVRTSDNYTLKREHLSLKTPDGATIPLATQSEFAKAGYLRALTARTKAIRDSINYYPQDVVRAAPILFFVNPGQGVVSDQIELSKSRASMGRLYFHVPGGIKVGQHWLIVQFSQGEVQVPFRILTKDEEKELEKNWEEIKKAHDATFK
jgi:hypothetical protein